jgi:ubiquitin-activating enzyme E1
MSAARNFSDVEARFSRQIYAVGATAMRHMLASRVVIIGLSSVGAEIAKNVLLSGCNAVLLLDDTPVRPEHLESNYFIPRGVAPAEVLSQGGRANAVLPALSSLNPTATTAVASWIADNASTDADSDAELADRVFRLVGTDGGFGATAVALADPLTLLGWTPAIVMRFLELCHGAGLPVVLAEHNGLFCRVFDDFGTSFTVEDPVGEEPATFSVVSWERDDTGAVKLTLDVTDHMVPLVAGDKAVIAAGTTNCIARVTRRAGSDTIVVDMPDDGNDGQGFLASPSAQTERITVRECRAAVTVAHRAFTDPSCETTMSMTRDTSESTALYKALYAYVSDNTRLPRLCVADDAERFQRQYCASSQCNHNVAQQFALTCSADLIGIAAFIGGVASQEVLKAITHRYMPSTQFTYYDFREAYIAPKSDQELAARAAVGAGSLPSHAAVFGTDALDRFKNADLFVVGAGAIGCEYLKNLALLGCGLGPKGRITVTDPDSIEMSNLSRQFLFREVHVGQNKATTAAEVMKKLFGPKLKLRALKEKVHGDSAHPLTGIFNRRFWKQCTLICTAVDNIAAREFLDDCAVAHRKPMVDSGTQAARGHVEVFAPFVTARFRDASAPADAGKAVPFCTLHFFPTSIEHCIQFAQELFNGKFTTAPQNAQRCLAEYTHPSAYSDSLDSGVRLNVMRAVHETLIVDRPDNVETAVQWARGWFDVVFVHPLRRLLENYPLDKKDDGGKPYWGGSKRPPSVPSFQFADVNHRAFVVQGARLWCRVHGVEPARLDNFSVDELEKIVAGTTLPEYHSAALHVPEASHSTSDDTAGDKTAATAPQDGHSGVDDEHAKKDAARREAEQRELAAIVGDLHGLRGDGAAAVHVAPEVFEKDDAANGHVAFLTAVANIRARAYGIPQSDDTAVKRIAGRIVPAMITTTAVVTGLATLQVCRLLAAGPPSAASNKETECAADDWHAAVSGCANVTINLADLALTQSFEVLGSTAKPFFEIPAAASGTAKTRQVGHTWPTFTSWDFLTVPHAGTMTIRQVITEVARLYHGLRVQQLVEESTNTWIIDVTDTVTSEETERVLDFPLVDWTFRLAKMPMEAFDIGRLSFVVKALPPVDLVSSEQAVTVNPQLPPLVLLW